MLLLRRRRLARPDGPLTEASLRDWCIQYLAELSAIRPEEIDTQKTFEEYGLDSRAAVQVAIALERIADRQLSPAIMYEHPTIDDLTTFLAREMELA